MSTPTTALVHDYSALSTLSECARKFEYKYIERLRPKEPAVYLHAGTAIHAALEVLYTQEWALPAALDALRASWGSYITPRVGKYAYLTLGHLEIVLANYFEDRSAAPTALEDASVQHTRGSAEEALVFDWAGPKGDSFAFGGKPDLPTAFAGQHYIVDHKCTTQWVNDFWAKKLALGHQFRVYCAALHATTGVEYEGAYVNAIYIGEKAADPPQAWRTRQSVPNRLFGPWHYSAAHLEETWEWARALLRARALYEEIGHFPQNEQACGNYGTCEFLDLCQRAPQVRKALAGMQFDRWTPSGRLVSGADGNSSEGD